MSAREAFSYEPRDADLLKSQWVALEAFDVPSMWIQQGLSGLLRIYAHSNNC